MIAYIMAADMLHIKEKLQFEKFTFITDIEFMQKSQLETVETPDIEPGDMIVCMDGSRHLYTGICESFFDQQGNGVYTLQLAQPETMFGQDIFLDKTELLAVGVEDFIAAAITDNYINSGDAWTDKGYIHLHIHSHTPVYVEPESDQGTYVLSKFISTCAQMYGVFVRCKIENGLRIDIGFEEKQTKKIDIETTDIAEYQETYQVNAMARLRVKWIHEETESNLEYFLKTDGTITQDVNDPDRASGTTKCIVIESNDEEKLQEEVQNNFTQNSYQHNVTFKLRHGSRLYPDEDFAVGRRVVFRTKTGFRDSIVTQVQIDSESAYTQMTFGNLKIKLIDKIRSRR